MDTARIYRSDDRDAQKRGLPMADNANEALEMCPWAAVLVPLDSGWLACESVDDARGYENVIDGWV